MAAYGYYSYYGYGYGYYGVYGGGYYSSEPGAYGYHHGLTYYGESYYYSSNNGVFSTLNSGYETYAGAKEYYAASFGPSGSDISLIYRSVTANGTYSYSAGYSSNTYDQGSSAYFYGERFAETTQSTQSSTYEQQGSFGYSHTVGTFGESYFDGSYRGSYTVTDTTIYQGHVVPDESSSYSLRVYQDPYGYATYTSQHS